MRFYYTITGFELEFWAVDSLIIKTKQYGDWFVEPEESDGSPYKSSPSNLIAGITGRWKGLLFSENHLRLEHERHCSEVCKELNVTV